jgi:hypothetical protein
VNIQAENYNRYENRNSYYQYLIITYIELFILGMQHEKQAFSPKLLSNCVVVSSCWQKFYLLFDKAKTLKDSFK